MLYFLTQILILNGMAVPMNSNPIPDRILFSLREPHQVAVSHLKSEKHHAYQPLKRIAFDEKMPLKTRWKSLMLLSEVYGSQSLPELEQAITHKAWFMRSAGLTALEKINQAKAKEFAFLKLKDDPSLLVRMKALELLKDSSNKDVKELMWKKIHSPDSFHQSRGLWIRQDLAQVLLKSAEIKDLKKWVKLLHDSESGVQVIAALALKKIGSNSNDESMDLSVLKKRYPLQKTL